MRPLDEFPNIFMLLTVDILTKEQFSVKDKFQILPHLFWMKDRSS